ncbi:MAG: helix-turn-helix domain-containing protein [Microcystaceae cyanobacterium]
MAYTISDSCFSCGTCKPRCPKGAIHSEDGSFWIEQGLCNNCKDIAPEPICIVQCPVSSPMPVKAKKGRYKRVKRSEASLDLFSNGKNSPFASSMVVWEACKLLSGAPTLPWQVHEDNSLLYHRQVKQGRGHLNFRVVDKLSLELDNPQEGNFLSTPEALEDLDLRSACLHLIYAAYATTLENPWEESFVINDQQIETYLGLDKRKDLSKATKLTLIKNLVQTPCQVMVGINWPKQGKIPSILLEESPLWHLVYTRHHFQEDENGCKHLIGLTFRIKAGAWAKYFLNRAGYRQRTAFYQYGALPKFIPTTVMSMWQQHQGAVRMLLWLLFKAKIGRKQCITTSTLLQVAYGQDKIDEATLDRDYRKRLVRKFEGDLEVLNHYGIKAIFDPVTYPEEIQPLWAKLEALPDDAEEALEFWLKDGSGSRSLTDAAPRGKWTQLLKARILEFQFPPDWEEQLVKYEQKKQQKINKKRKVKPNLPSLSGEVILSARKQQGMSQRELAQKLGKSQSWIRDLERGRFAAKCEDQKRLRQVLAIQQD